MEKALYIFKPDGGNILHDGLSLKKNTLPANGLQGGDDHYHQPDHAVGLMQRN